MPYILQHHRDDKLFKPLNPGELNYAITRLLDQYLRDKGLSYLYINDCLGALEGAKLEFYRRVAVPYEDKKIKENGDVYSKENLTND